MVLFCGSPIQQLHRASWQLDFIQSVDLIWASPDLSYILIVRIRLASRPLSELVLSENKDVVTGPGRVRSGCDVLQGLLRRPAASLCADCLLVAPDPWIRAPAAKGAAVAV